jgi:Protein of unknown function (DUF3054)
VRAVLGVLADVCCVLAFVIIGRGQHHDGITLAGVAGTAWPFLAGLAVGVGAGRTWRSPFALVPTGLVAWSCTVVFGQVLRAVSGQGTDLAFVLVSAAFLGLFLASWRVAVRLAARSFTSAAG